MTRLSVALIVKNESEWIADCLASVRGVADQVVVVDTGSTDGTVALAEAAGAEVHHFPWCDDFSAARNESLRHCTGDWVLVMDADEAFERDSLPALEACLAQNQIHAFRIRINNYFDSATSVSLDMVTRPNDSRHPKAASFGWVSHFHGLRLFRRHTWVQFAGRIHELVDWCFEAHGMEIQDAEVTLHHFGKTLPDREHRKRTYYLELARQDAEARPEDKQAQFNFLLQALVDEKWVWAEQAARAYVHIDPKVPPMVIYGGATALQVQGKHVEALEWLRQLLDARPEHAAGWTRRAVSQAALGDLEEARRSFRTAIRVGPSYAIAYLNLGELEVITGRLAEARQVLEEGLKVMPSEAVLWSLLVTVGVREGRPDRAAADAARALKAYPRGGGGLWHRLVAITLAQKGDLVRARDIVRMGREVYPDDPELTALGEKLG